MPLIKTKQVIKFGCRVIHATCTYGKAYVPSHGKLDPAYMGRCKIHSFLYFYILVYLCFVFCISFVFVISMLLYFFSIVLLFFVFFVCEGSVPEVTPHT